MSLLSKLISHLASPHAMPRDATVGTATTTTTVPVIFAASKIKNFSVSRSVASVMAECDAGDGRQYKFLRNLVKKRFVIFICLIFISCFVFFNFVLTTVWCWCGWDWIVAYFNFGTIRRGQSTAYCSHSLALIPTRTNMLLIVFFFLSFSPSFGHFRNQFNTITRKITERSRSMFDKIKWTHLSVPVKHLEIIYYVFNAIQKKWMQLEPMVRLVWWNLEHALKEKEIIIIIVMSFHWTLWIETYVWWRGWLCAERTISMRLRCDVVCMGPGPVQWNKHE